MRNRILVVLLLMFLSCGLASGQCTLTATLHATDTSTLASVPVDFSTLATRGGGLGPAANLNFRNHNGYNFSSMVMPAGGNFTISAHLASMTGGTQPGTVILVSDTTGLASETYFGVYDVNGTMYLGFVQAHISKAQWSVNTVYAQPFVGSLPAWLELSAVNGIFTAYTSSDGVNWTSIAVAPTQDTNSVSAGIAVFSGDTNAGSFGTATLDHILVNNATPTFTNADFGTTGNAGTGEPNTPFTFTETLSSIVVTYGTTGSCTQAQLNAITTAENSGHYQVQTEFSLLDIAANTFSIKGTASQTLGALVCATCGEPGFPATATTTTSFFNASAGYTYEVALDVFFDNAFINPIANAGIAFINFGNDTKYDGHYGVTKAVNEYTVVAGPPLWTYQLGPYPNYFCSSRSIGTSGPDFKPFEAISPTFYAYFKGRSWCKRPQGSAPGTAWTCGFSSSIVATAYGENNSDTIDCTNWDLGIKGIWP